MEKVALRRICNDKHYLYFPWADEGTTIFAKYDTNGNVCLSKDPKSAKWADREMKVKKHQIYLGNFLKSGFYTVYMDGKSGDYILVLNKSAKVPDRARDAWDRSDDRLLSNGKICLSVEGRRYLGLKKDSRLKYTVDTREGFDVKVSIISETEYQDPELRFFSDAISSLKSSGYVEFKNAHSYGNRPVLPKFLMNLIEDVDYGLKFKLESGEIVISKKDFKCPVCGEDELWDVSHPISLHVCPHCAKNLKSFGKLMKLTGKKGVSGAKETLKDLDAFTEMSKDMLDAIDRAISAAKI